MLWILSFSWSVWNITETRLLKFSKEQFMDAMPNGMPSKLSHLTCGAHTQTNWSTGIISRHYCLFVTCLTSPRCSWEPYWCAPSPVCFRRRMEFVHCLKLTPKYVSQAHKHIQYIHTHTRGYIHLEHGRTIFDRLLTGSRWWCQGQLLLPHLCSAVRAQSSLWTAYYPNTAPGESNQLQRFTALTPDGVGDESSHYISAG